MSGKLQVYEMTFKHDTDAFSGLLERMMLLAGIAQRECPGAQETQLIQDSDSGLFFTKKTYSRVFDDGRKQTLLTLTAPYDTTGRVSDGEPITLQLPTRSMLLNDVRKTYPYYLSVPEMLAALPISRRTYKGKTYGPSRVRDELVYALAHFGFFDARTYLFNGRPFGMAENSVLIAPYAGEDGAVYQNFSQIEVSKFYATVELNCA